MNTDKNLESETFISKLKEEKAQAWDMWLTIHGNLSKLDVFLASDKICRLGPERKKLLEKLRWIMQDSSSLLEKYYQLVTNRLKRVKPTTVPEITANTTQPSDDSESEISKKNELIKWRENWFANIKKTLD